MLEEKRLNKKIVCFPLTNSQKRIWYTEKIYPGTSMYNIGGPVRIKGAVNFKLLEEAINSFVRKNEGLRIRFIEENGDVLQFAAEYEKFCIDIKDFSACIEPEEEFQTWMNREAGEPFILENSCLFKYTFFKISEKDCGYLAKFHHIIADGWSMNIMTEKICRLYTAILNQEPVEHSPEPSYFEYIEHEQKYLSSQRFDKNKLYWNEKFKILPEAFLSKNADSVEGKRKTYELPGAISEKIREFSGDRKFSLNTFFVSLYIIYLFKTTQHKDIVIGTPVLNRSGKKEKSMFGMFTSTMPFRFRMNPESSINEMMSRVNDEIFECYYNQKYPYNLLLQDLELKKKGYDGLFDICVNYYNTHLHDELDGAPIDNTEFYNGCQFYSLQLVIKDWSESKKLKLDFDYKLSEYNDNKINEVVNRLNNLMIQILANHSEKINNLSLLSEEEKKVMIIDFNQREGNYPKNKSIYRLFEEQAAKTPDKAAIRFNNRELTYKNLNDRANQLARVLVGKGVKPETIVGLLTNHSIETVVGILAIIKAGGAYLPIDPGYPSERINYMLEDSEVSILLTNYKIDKNTAFKGEVIEIDDESLYQGETDNLDIENKPGDLVYVIYTSGSTGKPKGSMIEHRGLVNYIWWAKKVYVKSENEVFPLYSSLAFDLTVTSIFTPLITGSKIIVYRDDGDEYVLYRIMKDNEATIVKLTPSHLSLLKDRDNRTSSVKRFIVGGEDLKVNLARGIHESFAGNIEIYNEYGPTETVVGCMIYKYDIEKDTEASVPIGIPADNVQIYLLDAFLNPVPPGSIGEMFISGDGVARGYLNKPDLTRERFLNNPFIEGKRMYRTGDLARFLDCGVIEYAGRIDHQVKIRGHRIELAEIEKRILEIESIIEAVVLVRDDKNGKCICAYIVKKDNPEPAKIREYLMEFLPEYMIPAYFIPVDSIPLTNNGKVDRKQLPEPSEALAVSTEYVAGRNAFEEEVLNIFRKVLDVGKISIKDNFYHLGGDSIKAIQIASKLNENGLRIKVKDILSNPLIENILVHVKVENLNFSETAGVCEGFVKPTPITAWFFEQEFKNADYFNQSVLLEILQDMDVKLLEKALGKLIEHHDSLRLNYDSKTKELYYNNKVLESEFKIETHELTGYTDEQQKEQISHLGELLKGSLSIESGALMKACIFNLGRDGKRLLLTAHHIAVDGVSWRILLEDLAVLLEQASSEKELGLPNKTVPMQKWAEELDKYGKSIDKKEAEYWKEIVGRETAFTADFEAGEDTVGSCETIEQTLSEEETGLLMSEINEKYNTRTGEILVAALSGAIGEVKGKSQVLLELEGHGREEIIKDMDASRTVGWFTSMYPAAMYTKSENLGEHIKYVKEELRSIPDNGIGFGVLKYLTKSIDDKSAKKIRFNYMGEFGGSLKNSFFRISGDPSGLECSRENRLSCLLDIIAIVMDGRLRISITYSRERFKQETVTGLLNEFIKQLKDIISHCSSMEDTVFTPSDFDTVDITQEQLDKLLF